jgi:hypothetical protein
LVALHEVLNKVRWEEEFGNEPLEKLFDKSEEVKDKAKKQTSFTWSVIASCAWKSTGPDEVCLNEVVQENGFANKIADPRSQMERMEIQEPALESATGSA